MNSPGLGGRGKRAPYETTHYRIPQPLKPLMEKMVAVYREQVVNFEDPEDPTLINAVLEAIAPPKTEVIEILTKALTLKANVGGAIKEEIRKALSLLT